jgi:hypothetical protein
VKGRNPTADQKRFHDALCSLVGCIACRKMGHHNTHVSVHHIDGRTKLDAHWLVLPLCAGHHQNGTGVPGLTAVHPYKTRFEREFGYQRELLEECREIVSALGFTGPTGP